MDYPINYLSDYYAISSGANTKKTHWVFLLDFDNTLFNNDSFEADFKNYLDEAIGQSYRELYWAIFENLRQELGYADYLGAIQRYRFLTFNEDNLLDLASYVLDYPFKNHVYPDAIKVLHYLNTLGTTVIVSDGDIVFQPHKIKASGIWDEVDGRVLIYVHKEKELEDIQRKYPADFFMMVDDKPRILKAMKDDLQKKLTTIFVRQGHFAFDPRNSKDTSSINITINSIGELAPADICI